MIRVVLRAAALLCIASPAALSAEAPVRRPQTGTMMKPVVCRVLEEGRGKSGEQLASVVERDGARLALSNYELAAILPGDPPIACYRGRVDPGRLPPGAR
jgi:hypothetical protein